MKFYPLPTNRLPHSLLFTLIQAALINSVFIVHIPTDLIAPSLVTNFMAEKQKLSPAEKIRIAKLCIEGKIGPRAAARQVGVGMSTIQQWVSMYEFQGEDAFRELENYTTYSSEVKAKAVNDYLAGKGSQQTIADQDV